MTCEVDIVIPVYGQAELTSRCLESIARTTKPGQVRVIWVDNGSDPMERAQISAAWAELQPPLTMLPVYVPENLGFVKATNAGIALSTAPYVLLLNNDTEVPEGWLEKMVEVMEKEPTVGIVGPRSSSPHQWQGRLYKTYRPGYVLLGPQHMLAFFCALIRREVIVKCGYLSEEYQMGLGDDDDYAEVVKRAGWRLALRLDLTVTHHHRTTFRAIYGDGGWEDRQNANLEFFRQKWKV